MPAFLPSDPCHTHSAAFTQDDPKKASYEVDDAMFAATQLAQTTMRSELGKIELDQTFQEREKLNELATAFLGFQHVSQSRMWRPLRLWQTCEPKVQSSLTI